MESRHQYLTVKAAAELLGVTATTLRNWDRAGKLTAKRDPVNGYRLYSIDEISTLLRESRVDYSAQKASSLGTPYAQPPSLSIPENPILPQQVDVRAFRLLIRQMSRAFRDSMGGGILERFEEISKLLYCKLYDERHTKGGSRHVRRFYYKPGDSPNDVWLRVNQLYSEAMALLPEVFMNGNHSLSADKKAVARIVQLLQDINLSEIAADIKGVVYEELVRNTFEKSDNQQFFTPRPVVEFIVDFVQPTVDQVLCDPACGSGGFLIAASNYISRAMTQSDHGSALEDYFAEKLIGFEIDRRMAWVAQMNLIMHGDGQGNIHYLSDGGSLAITEHVRKIAPANSIDLILTNPPFGSDFSDANYLAQYQLGRGKPSRRRGVLFIERCIRWLRSRGRLGIVIDDSVLNGKSNQDVRQFILNTCNVEAIVSLPEVTFMPYATAKASILFLRKKKSADEPQSPIFMAEVENVGRKPNGDPLYSGQRDESGQPLLQNDLPTVVEAWRIYQGAGEKALARFVPKVFICPAKRFTNLRTHNPEARLDVQFHHPSREVAEQILKRSIYSTPRLAELVSVRNVTAIPAQQDPDEVWNYIGLANIVAQTGEYTISRIAGSQLKSAVRLYRPGDILFSRLRPELRKAALIIDSDDEGYASSECLVLCPKERGRSDSHGGSRPDAAGYEVDKEYLHFMLRSDFVYGQLVYQVTGVGRPRVSRSTVLGLRIPLPPLAVQREIVAAYKLAWSHHIECRKRSEAALQEGDEALRNAYLRATERLCPA